MGVIKFRTGAEIRGTEKVGSLESGGSRLRRDVWKVGNNESAKGAKERATCRSVGRGVNRWMLERVIGSLRQIARG